MADITPIHQAIDACFIASPVSPTVEDLAAVVICAVADQVVPANGSHRNNEIRAELLAIAAALKGTDV